MYWFSLTKTSVMKALKLPYVSVSRPILPVSVHSKSSMSNN